jgi:hypothetical protein
VNYQRFAAYITTKNYINIYNNYNGTSKFNNTLVFTPTTIMELPNFSRYAFVINNMYFNSHKRIVFIVSTKEINIQNNSLKKLIQIPCGKFKHVRFDIDDLNYFDVVRHNFSWLWNKINTDCSTDIKSKITFNGTNYYYCGDKPLPPLPDECSDQVPWVLRDNTNPCTIKLNEMIKQNLFSESFSAITLSALYTNNDNKCQDCDCCKQCRP